MPGLNERFETASRQGITQTTVLTAMWWDCGALADQCNLAGLGPQADPGAPANGPTAQ